MHLVFVKRLVKFLWHNLAMVAQTLQKSPTEVKREQRIVKAMIIQGLLPVLTLAPGAYTLFAMAILGFGPFEKIQIPGGYTIQGLTWTLMYLNPVFDALTTFMVVKAYFDAFKATLADWVKKLKKKKHQPKVQPAIRQVNAAGADANQPKNTSRNSANRIFHK